MTKVEVCLWKYCLSNGHLKRYKFRRQSELGKFGLTVIRFKDKEVLKNIQGVRQYLENKVEEIAQNPPPSPSKGGQ